MLDEPFAGVDPLSVNEIQDIIRRLASEGLGIVITDHNVRERRCRSSTERILSTTGVFSVRGRARIWSTIGSSREVSRRELQM